MNPDFAFGTGNMISTTPDLLKWDAALLSGRLLNAASLRTMFTVPGNGKITTIKETDPRFPSLKYVSDGSPTVYAMGWMVPDPHVRWHGGHTFLFIDQHALHRRLRHSDCRQRSRRRLLRSGKSRGEDP
jgi:CubicO group peptidase (beta-lactamase class C family)